jgi:hypothetical protein
VFPHRLFWPISYSRIFWQKMDKNTPFQSQKILENKSLFLKIRQFLMGNSLLVYVVIALPLITYFGFFGAPKLFALGTPMAPNTVLDPVCAPTDPNCYVEIYPVTSTSTSGFVLKNDGTNTLWADGSQFISSAISATSGTVSIGDGFFDGVTSGFFNGNGTGTKIAVNATSTFTGDFANFQIAGVPMYSFGSNGEMNMTAYNGSNVTGRNLLAVYDGGSYLQANAYDSSGNLLSDIYMQADSVNGAMLGFDNAGGTMLLSAPSLSALRNQTLQDKDGTIALLSDISQKGFEWTARTGAARNEWRSVTYGNGLFVAVSSDGGTSDQIMTSPDGVNWTSRNSTMANQWQSVTYGNGLFVAVASNGTTDDQIMTSPDGVNWTSRTSPVANAWSSVTYGNGIFVAMASSGLITDQIITSPDGINWTSRTSLGVDSWTSITYGNGKFIAVSDGPPYNFMTSPDGVHWSYQTSPGSYKWKSITYGNGLFVAVASDGTTSDSIATSPDGITWTNRASDGIDWGSVTYGNGLFVIVPRSNQPIVTSPDGITWTSHSVADALAWQSVTYGNGLFVAVASNGAINNNVMTSGFTDYASVQNNNIYQGGMTINMDATISGLTVGVGIGLGDNTLLGRGAGRISTGGNNSFVGSLAAYNLSTGSKNTFFGSGAGYFGTVSSSNTLIGYRSGYNLQGGDDNVLLGTGSGENLSGGNNNIFLKTGNGASGITNGSANVFIGGFPGDNTSNAVAISDGDGNLLLYSPPVHNVIFPTPGTTLTPSDNGINFQVEGTSYFGGNMGIGTSSPGAKLEVIGDIISKGTDWTVRTGSASSSWGNVAYGNGLFVAVGTGNTTDSVMTSPDGKNWTNQTVPVANGWISVAYGNGLFVAVSSNGTTNDNIMTSPDGINWTSRTSPVANQWWSVAYGNGMFVATSLDGTASDNIMTSPDGINWTSRTSPVANSWYNVTYGNGLFVAVAINGTTSDQIMTSPDGIIWTARTSPILRQWYSVTYGNGLFVATSISGSNSDTIMTSPDGINWTTRNTPTSGQFVDITYGNGLFVTVAYLSDEIMTSPDGINWTTRTAPIASGWNGLTYGNGVFVVVSISGTSDILTSGFSDDVSVQNNNIYQGGMTVNSNLTLSGYSSSLTNPLLSLMTAPIATSTFGLISIGDGGFTGMTAHDFTGSSLGTLFAINATSTFDGNLMDLQANGVSVFKVATTGALTIGSAYSLPTADGTAGYVVTTDGAGQWIYSAPGAATMAIGSSVTTGTSGSILYVDGSGNLAQDNSNFFWDATNNRLGVGTATPGSRLSVSGDIEVTGNIFSKGVTWTSYSSPKAADDVMYGGGLFIGAAAGNGFMTSPDGINWTSGTPAAAVQWTNFAYGNGMYVGIAQSGTTAQQIMTSSDGVNWTSRTSPNAQAWQSITYGNGLFVAVANDGTTAQQIMTSSDGIVWTARTSPNAQQWKSIVYGNGTFVAVASNGVAGVQVMTSTNGITWSSATSTSADTWWDVTYGNGTFVAVSTSGAVMTSPDGTTWTSRAPAVVNIWKSVGYGNGLFVAVSSNGTNRVMTSPDGITWKSRSAASVNQWQGVAYGNGTFVAVTPTASAVMVSGSQDSTLTLNKNIYQGGMTVNNNLTLTGYSSTLTNALLNINGSPIATSTFGLISIGDGGFSHSGNSFNGSATGTYFALNATSTFTGDLFNLQVASSSKFKVDATGNIYGSVSNFYFDATNKRLGIGLGSLGATPRAALEVFGNIISKGTKWTTSTYLTNTWTSVTYGNGTFVAVASNFSATSSVAISYDGINWATSTTPFANAWTSVTYGNGLFVAVASNASSTNVATSPDGISWTARTGAATSTWQNVTYGNGLFVAVANNGTTSQQIMTSPDGVTWTARTSPNAQQWMSVTYGNGKFVAVAQNGTTSTNVMTSINGTTWSAGSTAASAGAWTSVTYGNGYFVAVGNNDSMRSTNGISWTTVSGLSAAPTLAGVTYGNGLWVAVNNNGGANAGVFTIPDLTTTWTRIDINSGIPGSYYNSIVYANGMFVAVGNIGNIVVSGFNDYITNQPNNIHQGGMTVNNNFTLSGYSSTLKNALLNVTGAPVATSTFALVSIGDGGFAGGGTNFNGSATGTYFGINAASGFTGDFLNFEIASTSKFKVDSNGNVTVSGPSGACVLTGGSATSGEIVAGTGAALYCSSDERLKTNITDLDSALDRINQLRPVEFNWNNDPTGNKSIGFIAQEIQKIYPQFVSVVDPATGYLGVNYQSLVTPIIKSIQEMDLKLETLKSLDQTKDNSLASLIKKYLSDSLNGIGTIFTNRVQTKELCIEDTCVTKSQLQQLLNQANVQPVVNTPPVVEPTPPEEDLTPPTTPPVDTVNNDSSGDTTTPDVTPVDTVTPPDSIEITP